MTMKHFLILHGPNLNLLGAREPEHYGTMTLAKINRKLRAFAKTKDITLRIHQSNGEGDLMDWIHKNRRWAEGMVFNPAAYTHTSYALRDCVAAMPFPTVEVHLSAIQKREKLRGLTRAFLSFSAPPPKLRTIPSFPFTTKTNPIWRRPTWTRPAGGPVKSC